jgi:hypothetical protein
MQLGDGGGRSSRANGGDQGVERGSGAGRSVTREARGDRARIGEKVDGFLVLDLRDEGASRIDGLGVLFDGDADDVGESAGRMVLRRGRWGPEQKEQEPQTAVHENRSHHPEKTYRDC